MVQGNGSLHPVIIRCSVLYSFRRGETSSNRMTFKNREIQLDSGWRFPEEMSEVLDTGEAVYHNGGGACRRKRAAPDVGVTT